jgi:hypothetical protein
MSILSSYKSNLNYNFKHTSKFCDSCKVIFPTQAELLIHKSVHHDQNDTKSCPVCGKYSPSKLLHTNNNYLFR